MSPRDFQERIWPLKDRLYRFALRLLGDGEEAADAVQETLIKIWDHGDEIQSVNNLEAWSLRLVRNVSIDKLRGGYRKRRTDLDHAPVRERSDEHTPARSMQQQDTFDHVRRLMATLPEAQRDVMHLRDIEGLSYQEIADALGQTMPQVKTNLHRARTRIREALIKTESYGL